MIRDELSDVSSKKLVVKNKLIWLIPLLFLITSAFNILPVGFYSITRFIISLTSLYFCCILYKNNERIDNLFLIYGLIAILYNPIIKIRFSAETWSICDLIIAFIYLSHFLFLFYFKETKSFLNKYALILQESIKSNRLFYITLFISLIVFYINSKLDDSLLIFFGILGYLCDPLKLIIFFIISTIRKEYKYLIISSLLFSWLFYFIVYFLSYNRDISLFSFIYINVSIPILITHLFCKLNKLIKRKNNRVGETEDVS